MVEERLNMMQGSEEGDKDRASGAFYIAHRGIRRSCRSSIIGHCGQYVFRAPTYGGFPKTLHEYVQPSRRNF
jgi:hypothetical protein